ncbi:MAG: hypothetical protein CVU44_05780 [Chloroflexi bacterium HGW-Chloroflexi-6]|nr:MAG: hypothetical protein CVU44_05780 [Chloroflexi bacterium HGW-Chloroflexi-6]
MPLDLIPAPKRLPLFWLFFGLTLGFFAVFNWLDQPLHTSAAPSGIVSYELAGSPEAANAMLASWDGSARLSVAFGLGFDFLFMPIYATALSLSVLLAADRRRGEVWSALGKALGWGAFLATGFDAVENISLFHILLNGAFSPMPQLAFWCASIKFTLLIGGIVYALWGLFRQ